MDQVLPCTDYTGRQAAWVRVRPPDHHQPGKYQDGNPPGCFPSPPLPPASPSRPHDSSAGRWAHLGLLSQSLRSNDISRNFICGVGGHRSFEIEKSRGANVYQTLLIMWEQVTLIWLSNSQTTQGRKLYWNERWGARKVPHAFVASFPVKPLKIFWLLNKGRINIFSTRASSNKFAILRYHTQEGCWYVYCHWCRYCCSTEDWFGLSLDTLVLVLGSRGFQIPGKRFLVELHYYCHTHSSSNAT